MKNSEYAIAYRDAVEAAIADVHPADETMPAWMDFGLDTFRAALTYQLNERGLAIRDRGRDDRPVHVITEEHRDLERFAGPLSMLRYAEANGLTIHVATRETCASHLEHEDDKPKADSGTDSGSERPAEPSDRAQND